jgi:cell division protein YceG involved in septum cleavage
MSPTSDWHDPFATDEEALERERRRAEREARRRGRRSSVGEKVQESQAAAATAAPPPVAAEAPPGDPVAVTREAPPATAEAAAPPTDGAAPPPRRIDGRPGGSGSASSLRNRRILAAVAFLVIAGLLVFGAIKVIDEFNKKDPPPPKAKPVKTTSITIPEGLDRDQIADEAKKAGLRGNYLEATKKAPKNFDLAKYGAKDAPNLEGFLFPDTWDDLPKNGTVNDLVQRQLEDFKGRIAGVDLSYAKSKNLTVYDVLKIASMIEREVQVPEERKLVSEVIYNRLAANNPLGIDATIRYEDQNYDEPLTESRLNTDTPYNTRTHPGLPPTPIANPGLDAIEAAANPAKGDLFYYVVKPGSCGEHVFASTKAAFDRAQANYQQALEAQGGSPTDC